MTDTVQSAPPSSEGSGTVEEAASKIEALLSGKKPEKQKAPPVEAAAEEAQSAQAGDANEEQTPETAPSDEDEAADEPSPPEAEDEAEGDPEEDKLYTVKINGKEEQVSLKEALAGYQRQEHFTREMQRVREMERTISSEVQEARQEREIYSQLLPALMQRMQQSLPQPPDPSLIDINPSAYLRQKEAYEQAVGDLQAAASEHQRITEQSQVEQARKLQAFVAENASKLPELVPEWKDKTAYERDRPKVRDYLKARGFSDDEINQAYDARLVAIAADGMRWRALQSSKFKPVAPAPEKALKPTPASSQPNVSQRTRAATEARNRLAKSGRVEDAAAAIRALL